MARSWKIDGPGTDIGTEDWIRRSKWSREIV